MTKFSNLVILHLPAYEDGTDRVLMTKFENLVVLHIPASEDGTECSETSAYKIQTPGTYPEENIQHTEHGESLQ